MFLSLPNIKRFLFIYLFLLNLWVLNPGLWFCGGWCLFSFGFLIRFVCFVFGFVLFCSMGYRFCRE
jgi:hypothetical protein